MELILYPLKKFLWKQYVHLRNCVYSKDNKIVPKIFEKHSILSHNRETVNVSQLSGLIAKMEDRHAPTSCHNCEASGTIRGQPCKMDPEEELIVSLNFRTPSFQISPKSGREVQAFHVVVAGEKHKYHMFIIPEGSSSSHYPPLKPTQSQSSSLVSSQKTEGIKVG